MKGQSKYMVSQKDGLKFHISYHSNGTPTLCGKTKFRRKRVNPFIFLIFDSDIMCEKCLNIAGYDIDGQPLEEDY